MYPLPGRGGLRARGRRDAPGPADPGAGPGAARRAAGRRRPDAGARGRAGPAPGRASLAGLIAALHPTLVYAATHVQVALLAATLLTATPGLGLPGRPDRPRPRRARRRACSLALLALTDPILALVGAGDGLGDRPGPGPRGARPGRSRWSALTAALGVAPWVARNARVHGEFVADQEHVRLRLLAGQLRPERGDRQGRPRLGRAGLEPARSAASAGSNASLWAARHEAGYLDDIALTAGRLPRARARSPSPSGRAGSSAGPWPTSAPSPAATPGSASAGSATSSSSTRPTPRRGTSSTGRATSA